jgi:hypothetical protein
MIFPMTWEYLLVIGFVLTIGFVVGRRWQKTSTEATDPYIEAWDKGYKQGYEEGQIDQYNASLPAEQSWKKYV